MFNKKNSYLGFLGFLGFISLRFFSTKNIGDLAYIGYFGFFASFFIAKISGNRVDERYYEDAQKAKAFIGDLAIVEIAVLMVLGIVFPIIREYLLIFISASLASLIIAYAMKLYILEER
ncbi:MULTISPECIES: DUF3796 domain-containing protein [unclassified Clostridium]|uniref:DUF3796 domain-containing protein n=1 Tax=unclassified Clostridium TaxID=2614128 RepID=UPI001D5C8613|nr:MULTISPECIES: DUF3796 domain-containing protein [unclassified Clostridium]MBN1068548.1 DUF3796 domain-containing protein [Clostridium botulinum]